MNKNIFYAIALVAVSCSNDGPGNTGNSVKEETAVQIELTSAESQVIQSNNDFSYKLFNSISNERATANVFFSPLATATNMAMIANGAAGNTRKEILDALGFADNTAGINDLNSAYQKLIETLPATDPKTNLHLAASMWVKHDLKINPDFIEQCNSVYKSEMFYMDTDNSTTIDRINEWCRKNTSGAILHMFDHNNGNDMGRLNIINAVDFRGIWKDKFDEPTKRETFTATDGTECTIDMMHMTDILHYAYDDKIRIVRKFFGNTAFAIDFILPSIPGTTINDITTILTRQYLTALYHDGVYCSIELSVPKLTLETDYDMIPYLRLLGINDLFTPDKADLTNICSGLFASRSIQKAKFTMDEKGAEAQSVNSTIMGDTSIGTIDHNVFTLDRPFIFMITETSTGAILFMGKVERF